MQILRILNTPGSVVQKDRAELEKVVRVINNDMFCVVNVDLDS